MSGEIVYEVPPDSRGLQLDYRPFLREDTHTWYIGAAEALPKVKAPQAKVPQAEAPQTASSSASAAQTASSSASAAQVPAGSETELIEAAVDYYQAVDQEDWAYTYDNLDSQTRSMFTEEEWYAKNQWYADNEGLELSSINVVVNGPTSEPVVSVTIYRTFEDGTSITRDTSSPRRAASGSTASPRKRSASSCRGSPTRGRRRAVVDGPQAPLDRKSGDPAATSVETTPEGPSLHRGTPGRGGAGPAFARAETSVSRALALGLA